MLSPGESSAYTWIVIERSSSESYSEFFDAHIRTNDGVTVDQVKAQLRFLGAREIGVLDTMLLSASVTKTIADALTTATAEAKVKKKFRSEERRVGKECRSRWSAYQ